FAAAAPIAKPPFHALTRHDARRTVPPFRHGCRRIDPNAVANHRLQFAPPPGLLDRCLAIGRIERREECGASCASRPERARRDYKLGCRDKLAGHLARLRPAMLDALPFGDPARSPHYVSRAGRERRIDVVVMCATSTEAAEAVAEKPAATWRGCQL